MKKIIYVILFIFCFSCFSLYADDWEELQSVAQNIKSVSADFTQEKHMKILKKPLVSKGKFFFAAPGSLRWEYVTPVKSILLMHNGKVKSYISGDKGLVEDSRSKSQAMSIVMQEITLWLNGKFREDPNFNASIHAGKIGKIILTPKEQSFSKIIQSIELSVSRKKGETLSVKISENKDSYTLLKFSNSRHNTDIDDSLFRKPE